MTHVTVQLSAPAIPRIRMGVFDSIKKVFSSSNDEEEQKEEDKESFFAEVENITQFRS